MDPESQKRFDEITAKDVASLTEAELAFLRARSPYLTTDQREVFADVLEETAGTPGTKPYSKMTLAELQDTAASKNVVLEDGDKKAQVIEKLEAADAAAAQ